MGLCSRAGRPGESRATSLAGAETASRSLAGFQPGAELCPTGLYAGPLSLLADMTLPTFHAVWLPALCPLIPVSAACAFSAQDEGVD